MLREGESVFAKNKALIGYPITECVCVRGGVGWGAVCCCGSVCLCVCTCDNNHLKIDHVFDREWDRAEAGIGRGKGRNVINTVLV